MTDAAVTLAIDDGVAAITLDQPERRNALSHEMAGEIHESLEAITDSDARVVVLEGAGSAFSAGGDIAAMEERLEAESVDLQAVTDHIVERTGRAIAEVYECGIPTIAVVDGPAFGAGAALAIAADVVLASDRAQISFGFRQVGLGVDAGTSFLLARIVGETDALDLVYTGDLVGAERSERLGLFTHVYDEVAFDEKVDAYIDHVADGPTIGLRASKRSIQKGLTAGSIREAIQAEADAQAAVLDTRDHREGVEAFLEKRAPEFEGR
ncbi:MAG: enoyl-CoA hydratase/isomerase family protein [Halanaeroarchaeum sp.]